ncbi:MAG: hypothetical protein WDN06_09000 [Asticcacaulis sp.]
MHPRTATVSTPKKLLLDPYALQIDRSFLLMHEMFAGDSAKVMPKAMVCAPEPAQVDIAVPWDETVIYELHVRGFTQQMPEVPESLRGTFAGLGHPAGDCPPEILKRHHGRTSAVHGVDRRAAPEAQGSDQLLGL